MTVKKRLLFILTIPVRIMLAFLTPPYAFVYATCHAINEDSLSWFLDNWRQCFSHLTWWLWHVLAGYPEAGYYRLFGASGSCGAWVFHRRKPADPLDGRKWVKGDGFNG